MKKSRKSFTLIELLVVVAIIGILAAVGIPIFNGFMSTAKISAATENHTRARDMMTAYIAQCSTGVDFKLQISPKPQQMSTVSCNSNTTMGQFASYFGRHFYNTGFENPYTKVINYTTKSFIHASGCGGLGQTRMWHTGNGYTQSGYLTITTNVGTEDGKSKCITASILKE